LFALVARRVSSGSAEPFDRAVRERLQASRTPAGDVAAKPVTLLSMPGVVLPGVGLLVWWMARQGRRGAALSLGTAPLVAMTAGLACSLLLEQRNPPDASDETGGTVQEPSFPSGHTTGVTAEALSIAYVLRREGLASPGVLAALLGWPLLVGFTRAYRDRHWASDILGSWALGTAIAAGSGMVGREELGVRG
jgi:membrane-associated phospholipid phosphatase